MTTVLNEDWSGYPENTEVQNIAGWTTAGYSDANRAGAKVNASSQIKGLTSDGTIAFYDAGGPEHSIELPIMPNATGGALTIGPAVRCSDHLNFISIRPYGGSNVQVYSYVDGSISQVAMLSYSHNGGDSYRLDVDNVNDTLQVFANDVSISSELDIAGLLSGNNVGFFTKIADPAIGSVTIESAAVDTITIDSVPDRHVYPVFGSTIAHTVSGSYSGPNAPDVIKCRAEEYVSGITVVDWFTLDASPALGIYSGTIDLPKGKYYKIITRFGNNHSVFSETQKIGFGYVFWLGGQSNMLALSDGGDAVALDDVTIFDGVDNWSSAGNKRITHALNAISQANNCVVAAYNTAENSSSIAQHLSGGTYYDANQAALTAAGGKLNGFIWGQGEGDTGASYGDYLSNLGLLYNDTLSKTGQSAATLPMFIVQLGRNAGQTGNDIGWQTVREAQTEFANANQHVHISHQTMDLPMPVSPTPDSLHRNAAGYKMESLRLGESINSVILGVGNSGRGPIPLSASVNGTQVIIPHNLNGSTAITLPPNAKDGYVVKQVSDNSVVAVTSATVESNNIALDLASLPDGEVIISSQQGQDPDVAKMPIGTKLYDGQAVMVEPIVAGIISVSISSTLNMTVLGAGNQTLTYEFYNRSTKSHIKDEDVTFLNDVGSVSFSLGAGSIIGGFYDGDTPPTTGTGFYGVTE